MSQGMWKNNRKKIFHLNLTQKLGFVGTGNVTEDGNKLKLIMKKLKISSAFAMFFIKYNSMILMKLFLIN